MFVDMLEVAKILRARLRLKTEYSVLELLLEERDDEEDHWVLLEPTTRTYLRVETLKDVPCMKHALLCTLGREACRQHKQRGEPQDFEALVHVGIDREMVAVIIRGVAFTWLSLLYSWNPKFDTKGCGQEDPTQDDSND